MRVFRCSKFVRVWLFLFAYCLFISYGRHLVELCVLLNWLTERNCLTFSDVKQKETRKKTGDAPISRKFCTKRQLTALGSLTRRSSPQWLCLHLFIKNLSIDHERFLQGNISYGSRKQLLYDVCWHSTRILSTDKRTIHPKIR